MPHTFNYAILMAIPDKRRGERVNVGIAVFLQARIDIRFAEVSKMRALTGVNWSEYVDVAQQRLADLHGTRSAEEIVGTEFDAVIRASKLGWFEVESLDQYEDQVKETLAALVLKPKADPRPRARGINAEITRQLEARNVLAKGDETIASGKVVRNFPIEDDFAADFAIQNGRLHVATTLDLRRQHIDIKQATLKAIILDRATERFGEGVRNICVYAAPDEEAVQRHISLMNHYADVVYNWSSPEGRQGFTRAIFDAYGHGHGHGDPLV